MSHYEEPIFYEKDADSVDYNYWVNADYEEVLISAMDVDYIKNIIHLLERTIRWDSYANQQVCERYIEILNKELSKR